MPPQFWGHKVYPSFQLTTGIELTTLLHPTSTLPTETPPQAPDLAVLMAINENFVVFFMNE